jgi:hypothetical protein
MFPTPQVFSLVYAYRRKNECNLTQFIYKIQAMHVGNTKTSKAVLGSPNTPDEKTAGKE